MYLKSKIVTATTRFVAPMMLIIMTMMGCIEQQGPKDKVATPQHKPTERQNQATDRLKDEKKVILCFGNSLTAGYGLDEDQAYPAILQRRIDSLNWPYKVVNAGLSGETSADGQNRIDWVLRQPMDVFILELGANDMLRGLDLDQTQQNLQSIIDKVRTKLPQVPIIVTGMQAPPNLGTEYTSQFAKIFPTLAETTNIHLVPFLLEGVAGKQALNQADGIHPNQRGTLIMTDNIWRVLQPILDELKHNTD